MVGVRAEAQHYFGLSLRRFAGVWAVWAVFSESLTSNNKT